MALRFFADHCLPRTVVKILLNEGHEVLNLKDHMPPDSTDSEVIRKAQELDSILVSLNGDFADIVAFPPDKYKGIISLQVRNRPEIVSQLMEKLTDFISAHPEKNYYAKKLILVEVHRIRIRGY